MQNLTRQNLEFGQTLQLLQNSMFRAKNILAYSGENEQTFDQTLKEILESREVSDPVKIKLFSELDYAGNLVRKLFEIDKRAAETEIERLFLEVIRLKKDDVDKVMTGIKKTVGG